MPQNEFFDSEGIQPTKLLLFEDWIKTAPRHENKTPEEHKRVRTAEFTGEFLEWFQIRFKTAINQYNSLKSANRG
jgi:hypothetical protein